VADKGSAKKGDRHLDEEDGVTILFFDFFG
jgi:hypothetical protein